MTFSLTWFELHVDVVIIVWDFYLIVMAKEYRATMLLGQLEVREQINANSHLLSNFPALKDYPQMFTYTLSLVDSIDFVSCATERRNFSDFHFPTHSNYTLELVRLS